MADKLTPPKTAMELLEMYFLEARCHLLETAAVFDRIERAEGADEAMRDPRFIKLAASLEILRESGANRAESFLNLFSEE